MIKLKTKTSTMKKSRVAFSPTINRDQHTTTGISFTRFFRSFEGVELTAIPAAFNNDNNKPNWLVATLINGEVEVSSTENGHVVARFVKYE